MKSVCLTVSKFGIIHDCHWLLVLNRAYVMWYIVIAAAKWSSCTQIVCAINLWITVVKIESLNNNEWKKIIKSKINKIITNMDGKFWTRIFLFYLLSVLFVIISHILRFLLYDWLKCSHMTKDIFAYHVKWPTCGNFGAAHEIVPMG